MTAPAHWIIAPVVLPLLAGALLALVEPRRPRLAAALSLANVLALLATAGALLGQAASGTVRAYLLGNWQAPFGIVLVLDRLSALMLLLTAFVALGSLLYARGGDDRRGPHFNALFQFQLMGLNGAFLTGDLFNLFVFFEVLLIASYGLLLHGAGTARLKAAVHYVSFNLTGSALFLVAVSLLYGLTGTLNMADLAMRVASLPAADLTLAHTAGLLLLVVFCVKAALLPLYFWLPETYSSASAPVAALFAIMTKVGVYAIARVYTLVFGDWGGPLAGIARPWLPALAMATLLLGTAGALAAGRLRGMAAYAVVASAGTLLLALGLGARDTVAAALFYLVDSTLVAAAMFLLVDRIASVRPTAGDALRPASMGEARRFLGVAFFVLAVAAAGMPPLGGFIGKAMLLSAAQGSTMGVAVWAVLLLAALGSLVALARAGSMVFWEAETAPAGGTPVATPDGRAPGREFPGPTPPDAARETLPPRRVHAAGIGLLGAGIVAVAVFAGPLSAYTQATAWQLFDRQDYLRAVFGATPAAPAADVRREMRAREKAGPKP